MNSRDGHAGHHGGRPGGRPGGRHGGAAHRSEIPLKSRVAHGDRHDPVHRASGWRFSNRPTERRPNGVHRSGERQIDQRSRPHQQIGARPTAEHQNGEHRNGEHPTAARRSEIRPNANYLLPGQMTDLRCDCRAHEAWHHEMNQRRDEESGRMA